MSDPSARQIFATQVVKGVTVAQNQVIELNHGFNKGSDVVKRMQEGDSIAFDYDRLLDEAAGYV